MAFAVTAVVTAIEVGTVAAALTAIAEVGMVMSVVGTVTHSKELTKVGGTLALVGGIGSLANGALTSLGTAAADGMAAEGAASAAEAGWSDIANDAVAGINSGATPSMVFDGATGAATGTAATAPGLSAANSLDGFLSKGADMASNAAGTTGSAASGVSGLVPNASGVVADGTNSPFLNDYGLPANAATDKVLGVAAPAGIMDLATPADGLMAQLKSKAGAAWDGLGSLGKAEVLKSVLAMPGGIQNQKNIEDQIAIQQQKANQTSYGSAVPTFGIINKARG